MSNIEQTLSNSRKSVFERQIALWRNSDYFLLWSGQTISQTGSGISQIAYPLLILSITRSPFLASIAGVLGILTFVLFSLPAGALVDRWDRKRVMIICDGGRALSLASIPIAAAFGHLTLVQLYVTSFVEGTLYVFFSLAQMSALPRVVTKDQVPDAMSQNQVTYGITALLSPSLGGLLFAISRVLPFIADAVSYLFSVCSLFFIKTQFQEERKIAPRKLMVEIMEGLTWLWQHPLILSMALLVAGINFVLPGDTLVIIVQAQHQHASSVVIGLIIGIGGVGSILGSFFGPILKRRYKFGVLVLSLSWLFVIVWALFALAPNPLSLGLIQAGIMFLGPIYNIVLVSYRLTLIPDELQGRVNSVARLIAMSAAPIGIAVTGLLLQAIGVVPTVIVFTVFLAIFALAATLNAGIRNAVGLVENK
jgi:MFS family permease